MPIVNIEILKQKFESGDYPRSRDYMDLIDTLSQSSGAADGVQVLTNKTINGEDNILLEIPNSALANSVVSINGSSVSLGGLLNLTTDDILEGSSNKYFNGESAQDSVNSALTAGTGIIKSYDDNANTITISANTSVLATTIYADSIGSASSNSLSLHESDTTNIHGIANTALLATQSYVSNAISTHESNNTNIHGIADTSALATKTYADEAAANAAAAVIESAPSTLNTLNELAAAINDDASYASTITTALGTKAPIESPTFTGTVAGITKSMVGLGDVDNTTDAGKPVSTAQQTALDLKANLSGPTFTGTVILPSTTSIGDASATEIGYLDGVTSGIQTQLNTKASTGKAIAMAIVFGG